MKTFLPARKARPALRRTAQCAIVLVVLCVLALIFSRELGNEQIWWLELARFLPYPAYLVPAIGALALSVFLGIWWRLAAVAAVTATATVVMGLALGTGDQGSGRLRVMTYNIKSYLAISRSDGYAQIAWEVLQHDPDILFIQDGSKLSGPSQGLPETARAMLKGREIYSHGQYMLASRYPLRACRNGQIPYRGEEHSYIRCIASVAGTDIDLVTAHFVSPREGLAATRHQGFDGLGEWRQNFTDRMTQANLLAGDLARRVRPMIVAGDLNAVQGSPVLGALLATGLRDAFASAGLGYGFTYGHALRLGFSFLRIDHILVSSSLGVRDCFVGGREGSEHRPVIADLLLTRRG